MKISRFFLIATVILAGLLLLMWSSAAILDMGLNLPAMNIAVGLGYVLALLAYIIVYFGIERGTMQFMTAMVGGMIGKMLLGIVSVLIVALKFRSSVEEYVAAFFISYFVFTSFEVYGLMRKLRA